MSRPYKPEITDDHIIARLQIIGKATVHQLANRLQETDDRVRVKLIRMLSHGKVARKRENNSNSFFEYFLPTKQEQIANGEFEVATPLIGITMTGELTGYVAEFERRTALCMTLRRAA
ncbi:hypothetical protein [Caballeronia sp. LZ001]|uniref:hypothetical protein n=1 Tax=Caballeronia sp. LZ001 TaxID=3038553 RepID=UPI002864517D|nr:hypothetical protein [Caballeronia sp. LZ001]MDR5802165.1 hypothetical protein [Caballeronia sp. LZ001]